MQRNRPAVDILPTRFLSHPEALSIVHTVLLRLLFPSWAFFDRVTEVARLELRTLEHGGVFTPWRSALIPPSRRLLALVYHPQGTAHLAQQSAVERFAVGVDAQVFDQVAHDIVAAIAGRAVSVATPGSTPWQWRVVAVDHAAPSDVRVVFESTVQSMRPRGAVA
jgi:hypothetical protein